MNANKQARRKELYDLLGDLPPRTREIRVRQVSREEKPGYVLEKLLLDLNGVEPVPAYFVSPLCPPGPMPAILFNHSHCECGKDEMLRDDLGYLQTPNYAAQLTGLGYCALCIDTWEFGERSGRTESEIFKEMLWHGRVMWGMMVYDSIRALDYLCSRPEADSSRIGTLGLSMGSTMAWWLAALDERIKVCADICCMTDFHELIATGALDRHGIYYYVPGLLKRFTTAQINELIVPRAHLSLAGNLDPLTPPRGLDRIDAELSRAYAREGAGEAWKMARYDVGHLETPEMRGEILAFLDRWL